MLHRLITRRWYHVGQSAQLSKQVTDADIRAFSALSLDTNPIHLDDAYAKTTRFGRRIAHGMVAASLLSGILGTQLPGAGAIYLSQTLKFVAPVFVDDVITATVTVRAVDEAKRTMTMQTTISKADGTVVIEGEAKTLLPKKASPPPPPPPEREKERA